MPTGILNRFITRSPFSLTVVGLLILDFLLGVSRIWDSGGLIFIVPGPAWTALTQWIVIPPNLGGLVTLIFAGLVTMMAVPELESDLGIPKVFGLFALGVVASSLGFALLTYFSGYGGALFGPWPTIDILLVAWCLRRPTATVLLFGMFPVSAGTLAKVLPLFGALSVVGSVLGGIGAILGMYAAYFLLVKKPDLIRSAPVAAGSKPLAWEIKRDKQYREEVKKREQERADRERLKRMFEVQEGDADKDDK